MKLLNTPVRIGGIELKNRIVMPPMATEKSEGGGVSEMCIRDRFRCRAKC